MSFRLTAPVPSESDIHEACASALDTLLLRPAEWISLGIGALKLTPAQMARLTRVGIKPGWPDLIICYHSIYGVEIKKPGKTSRPGRLSTTRIVRTRQGALREVTGQVEMFCRLEQAGMRIAIVTSVGEMLDALMGWGVPLRPHHR
jgi:hypothetical protein